MPAEAKPPRQKPGFCERWRVCSRRFAGNVQSAPNRPSVVLVFSRGANKGDPPIVPNAFEQASLSTAARPKFLPTQTRIVDSPTACPLHLPHRLPPHFLT